jgi:hypothetical protein
MIVSLRHIALSAMVALCNMTRHTVRGGTAGRVDHDERMNIQDTVDDVVTRTPGVDRSILIGDRSAHRQAGTGDGVRAGVGHLGPQAYAVLADGEPRSGDRTAGVMAGTRPIGRAMAA